MSVMQAIDHVEAGSPAPVQGPGSRATGQSGQFGHSEQAAELAQRVRALRRARRDARTRAARVRRALLAPTWSTEVPYPTRHTT